MRIVVIGQAPARPGSKHAIPGSYVKPWLRKIGLTEEFIDAHFDFLALVPTFPGSANGSHLAPTPEQIAAHRPTIISHLQTVRPSLVVPVGRLAIVSLLPTVKGSLDDIIGQVFTADPYEALGERIPIIPLPHPSGRSTWLQTHSELLVQALDRLQKEIQAS